MFPVVPKTPARKVESWVQVKDQAIRTIKFLREYNDLSRTGRRHFALHHAQISPNPLDLFVVPTDLDDLSKPMVVVMNAKITGRDEPVMHTEACISFPFRGAKSVKRYRRIAVEFDEFNEKEGLVHRTEKMEDLMAYIFQHEIEHSKGRHIY
jgi:peptide deformylase